MHTFVSTKTNDMNALTLPTEMIKELQTAYDNKKVSMFQVIGCFTTIVGNKLSKEGYTMEEKAKFFKSKAYNERLNEFKLNFKF